jgi:hypothetical protein
MEIRNKVAESGIITIDLESYFSTDEIIEIDIKNFLFKELILKEIEYRTALKNIDWTKYQDKIVAIYCSSDAILPLWAFMLMTSYLTPYTSSIYYGDKQKVEQELLLLNIKNIQETKYIDQRIVIKGCGDRNIPNEAYIIITKKLMPHVKSLFFGEPCSTVPIYKKK